MIALYVHPLAKFIQVLSVSQRLILVLAPGQHGTAVSILGFVMPFLACHDSRGFEGHLLVAA